MDEIKYLVLPDFVRSRSDGDKHWISGRDLIRLYDVNPAECMTINGFTHGYSDKYLSSLIPLRPQESGDYTLPQILTKWNGGKNE